MSDEVVAIVGSLTIMRLKQSGPLNTCLAHVAWQGVLQSLSCDVAKFCEGRFVLSSRRLWWSIEGCRGSLKWCILVRFGANGGDKTPIPLSYYEQSCARMRVKATLSIRLYTAHPWVLSILLNN